MGGTAPPSSTDVVIEIPTMRPSASFCSSGMPITVNGLTYTVKSNVEKGKDVTLLNQVTAYFLPCQMSALMGPSGSGKTTLLDLLAGRKTAGTRTGDILFAGQPPSQQFLRRYTGYVEQFDTLLPILTVEEMLLYTAELKRPRQEPLASKKAAVAQLLDKLALRACRDVQIGDSMSKGISGGQAKRTNIGIAMVTNPRVLMLDEPTSGLDSFTSNEVMTLVKGLVKDGVTILATIHSPTAYAFSLFDSLTMLVKGRVVYFGPVGQPAVNFVRSTCGKLHQAEAHIYNEAEWLVDVFAEADRAGSAEAIADAYEASALKQAAVRQVDLLLEQHAELPPSLAKEMAVKRATVTPAWWGLRTLIKYRTTRSYKDAMFLGPRLTEKFVYGLLMLTLYLGIGRLLVPDNYVNISGALFMWVTLPAFGAACYVPALVLERSLFVRERADGLYRVVTYLAAKMFDELTLMAFVSVGVSAAVFYAVGFQGSFLLFWLTYFVTLCNGIALAYFIAAASPNMDTANTVLPLYVTMLLFFAGFLITFDRIPPWWGWFSYINFLRYAWVAVMINQFREHDTPWVGNTTVLGYYGMAGDSAWANLGYCTCFFVFFTFCAWATLSFKRYASR